MTSKKLNFETGLVVGAILLIGITVFVNRIVSNLALGRFVRVLQFLDRGGRAENLGHASAYG